MGQEVGPDQAPSLRLPGLPSREEYSSVVNQPLSLWGFVTAA